MEENKHENQQNAGNPPEESSNSMLESVVSSPAKKDWTSISIWITVFALFGLVVFSQIWDSNSNPEDNKAKKTSTTTSRAVASQVQMQLMLMEMQQLTGNKPSESALKNTRSGVKDLLASEKDLQGKALLQVTTDLVTGSTIAPQSIELLSNSEQASIRRLGAILKDEKKTIKYDSNEVISNAKKQGLAAEMAAVAITAKPGTKTPILNHFGLGSLLLKIGVGLYLFGAVALGLIAWLVYFLNRKSWPVLGHPLEIFTLRQSALLGACSILIMIFFQLFMGIAVLSQVPARKGQSSEGLASPSIAIAGILFIILTLISLRYIKIGEKTVYDSFFKSTPIGTGKLILWGVGGAFANSIVMAIVLLISAPFIKNTNASHPIQEEFAKGLTPATFLILWIAAAVVAPIWEEIAFRGFLARGVHCLTGRIPVGIIVSSLIFAAIHPQGPALWLALGAVGAMCAMLTYQTRSILPAMVMHAVHNGTLLIMAYAFT